MTDINRVKDIKVQYKKGIIKKLGDNFSGIAVGYKFVGGKRTDEVCLQVFVKKKMPVSELLPGTKIPSLIEEVKTDVIEAEFKALTDDSIKLIGSDDTTIDAVHPEGRMYLQRFTAGATGSCDQIRIKCQEAGIAYAAIYDYSTSSLLAYIQPGTFWPTVAGWSTIPIVKFTSTILTEGTQYWLAIMTWSAVVGYDEATGYGAYIDYQYPNFAFPETLSGLTYDNTKLTIIAGWGSYRIQKYRPAFPGISIGHKDITAGTFGFVHTLNGVKYILSNNHVLANCNNAVIGDHILQPGAYDNGVDPTDKIGELHDFEPIIFGGGAGSGENIIDTAIALPSNQSDITDVIYEVNKVPAGSVAAELGQTAKKSGRTTGLTTGTVTSIDWEGNVGYDAGNAYFVGQIVVEGTNVVAGGDSGSVSFIEVGAEIKLIGLLFAGSGSNLYVANQIDDVLARFSNAPPLTVYSSASDGYILKESNVDYNTPWVAASGNTPNNATTVFYIGQRYGGGWYSIYRSYVYFDTSSIPSDAIITLATLSLYGQENDSAADFLITVQNGQLTYPHDPLVAGDYAKANYSGDGGSLNTSGFITTGENVITLNVDGRGWIQKGVGAVTKLCLRSSEDIVGSIPTGLEYVAIWATEKGTFYRPKLYVEYTVPTGDITIDAPLATVDNAGIAASLVRDAIFDSPVAATDFNGLIPAWAEGVSITPPLVTVDGETLDATLNLGISILPSLVTISGVALTPTLVLDRIFSTPLINIDVQALTPVISGFGNITISIPIITIDLATLIPSIFGIISARLKTQKLYERNLITKLYKRQFITKVKER